MNVSRGLHAAPDDCVQDWEMPMQCGRSHGLFLVSCRRQKIPSSLNVVQTARMCRIQELDIMLRWWLNERNVLSEAAIF